MSKRPRWKKAEARLLVDTLAAKVGELFAVPVPSIAEPYQEILPRNEWEFRFEAGLIWTGAGKAELALSVSQHFAHLYFHFDNPMRAAVAGYDDALGRLNRHSGKWNRIAAAPDALDVFAAYCIRDFRKVAEPNPAPEDVAAWQTKEAERAASFSEWTRQAKETEGGAA